MSGILESMGEAHLSVCVCVYSCFVLHGVAHGPDMPYNTDMADLQIFDASVITD